LPEGTLTSFTLCDAYRYFVGQSLTSFIVMMIMRSGVRRGWLMEVSEHPLSSQQPSQPTSNFVKHPLQILKTITTSCFLTA